jgi:hypothetical protein
MAKVTYLGSAKPDDPIYQTGPVIGAIRYSPALKMGKVIDHGWQEKADKAPQPTGIVSGANLKKLVEKPIKRCNTPFINQSEETTEDG